METGTTFLLGVAAASAVLVPGAAWLWFRARRLQDECTSLRDEAEAATEIAAAVPDGFLLRDIETGRSRCSRRLAVLLELARGTEGGAEDVIACFEPGPADLLRRSLENLYESGQGFSLIVPVADDRRTIQAIGTRAFRATGRPAADIVWFRDLARKGSGGQTFSGDGHFRALIDALPFPVWMQGPDGEVLFSNAAAQAGQAEDSEILSVTVPDTPLVFSYALPHAPGTPAQEDRSADWFRILETVPTAVAVYGPDAHLRFANAAFARLWRLDPGWLQTGPRFGDMLDRLRDARRLPEVPDYAAFRKQQVAQISTLSAPVESLMHLPDGTTLKRVVAPSPGGGIVFAYEDLSERLSLERSLNELNAVQRETLDNLFEGVAVFSADGHLRLSNPALSELWARDEASLPEDMHVTAFVETLHTFMPQGTGGNDGVLTAARLMSRHPHQGRLVRNDERVIEYATIPLPDGAVMVSFLDVTDGARVEQALRQRAEALGAANRLKSEFIANVSHEIRTPLTTLIGFAEILTDGYFGDLNRRQMEYGKGILETSRNLMSVVGDILDLASIEAGMMALELDAVDVHGLLTGILRLVRERARHKNLTIAFDCPTDICWIVADEPRLKQVFFNLMGNAIRFAPQRGKISLTARREGGEVVISVADNGPGMDPDLVAEITEPFRRGPVTECNRQGAGLGLALVSRFIELHNGRVEFRTRPGRGTKVICRLPTGETAESAPEESEERHEAPAGNREAAGD